MPPLLAFLLIRFPLFLSPRRSCPARPLRRPGILAIQAAKGLSLTDMLTYLHELVLQISYPPPVMNFLLSQMSNIEYRLSHGTNDKLQLASLVGVFKQACQMTEQFQADKEKRMAIKAAAAQ